jgi:hypothetical protein
MKKIIASIFFVFTMIESVLSSEDLVYGVKYNAVIEKNEIYSINLTTGDTTLKQQFAFPSGYWTPGVSFMDSYNGKYYLKDSQDVFMVYDVVNDTMSQTATFDSDFQAIYQTPWAGKNLIYENSEANKTQIGEGGETAIQISNTSNELDIQDANGDTVIKVTTDGATHIGENSLVTQEVNGVQQLYATNSAGNQIDLNIKSGTNLLIGGRNIMDIIGGDISGSVALSSALAALPNSSPDAFYTCGLGTGIHDSSSALSAGCASDFSNYTFTDNLPKIFQTASFNIGSSFLMNGEPDISEARDMSIKAGITFKFGSVKPARVAEKQNHMLENKIDAVMAKNEAIQNENDLLKAQIAEINSQLKALNMLAMN